ncbi:hypothetical protein ABW19_dt0203669 [Dactylella cylindrospora]|nr:hypothetical protein ABW19_dt0203669 [Dactylella cylindrospora]
MPSFIPSFLLALTLISILSTTSLYLYPLLLSCSYPNPTAPFRLLTLADPQLEGDTSIYSNRYSSSPPWLRELRRLRKTLDLWGNDLYLSHIFRTLHQTVPSLTSRFSFLPQGLVHPTHVTVLGDLIGSQWITDAEFTSRGNRFWDKVFKSAKPLPERALNEKKRIPAGIYKLIDWPNTLINIVGNHDIGYAGDIRPDLIQRFESTYGPVNYVFTIPFPDVSVIKDGVNTTITPKLRVINLNSLNIDSPARDYNIQMETYGFMNSVFGDKLPWDGSVATVLLTHVPLHKESGICVDGPMNKYYEDMYGGLLREQNHISQGASEMLLGELFGTRRVGEGNIPRGREMGIILNGHDHEGCNVVHWMGDVEVKDENGEGIEKRWKAGKWEDRKKLVGGFEKSGGNEEKELWVREVTVRSMMGEFGGNAGLTSAWFDVESMSWKFEYSTCPIGIQHIWWTVHIVDIITILLLISYGLIVAIAEVIDRVEYDRKVKAGIVPRVVVTQVNVNGDALNGEGKALVEKKVQ